MTKKLDDKTKTLIARFVALDIMKAEYKRFFEDYAATRDELAATLGVGEYFQDDAGTVYKTTEPAGKFVYFDKYDIVRTRRDGEEKGTLSVKEATAAGFTPVVGKPAPKNERVVKISDLK